MQLDRLLAADAPDLQGCELIDLDLRGRSLENVTFGAQGGQPARLVRVDATGSSWRACQLTGVTLQGCRFQGAELRGVDLRYVAVASTSFKGASLVECDLYRATFGIDVDFSDARIEASSLNLVDFGGANLPRSSILTPLLPEDPDRFAAFHARDGLRRQGLDSDRFLRERHREAAAVWRSLMAHWQNKGRLRDSGWAYVQARRNELRAASPRARWAESAGGPTSQRITDVVVATIRWLPEWLAGACSGFGESMARVLGSFVVLVLVMSGCLLAADVYVDGDPVDRWDEGVLVAFQTLTSTLPDGIELSQGAQWIAAAGTGAGIVLLGLLGFVLGNRIRNA